MTFRIFTNDRGKVRGVPMYSALCPLKAESLVDATRLAKRRYQCFGPSCGFAPVKAIEWPATSQASKDWLAKHT